MAAFIAVLIASGFGLAQSSVAPGIITGTILDDKTENPVKGIQVDFYDALNADLLGSALTAANGAYSSGDIPAGDYRVRFSDPGVLPGYLYVSKFYGAPVDEKGEGGDNFCAGTVVTVPPGGTGIADGVMTLTKLEPVEFVPFKATIIGTVTDASTGAPLQGITVGVFDPLSAVKLGKDEPIFTDANGDYAIGVDQGTAKVRFSDSTGAFFPEFFGVADRDEFCSAETITLANGGEFRADAALGRVPPEQLTQNLTDEVNNLDVPGDVRNMLGTPLLRTVDLLTDNNSNNDQSACGQLTAFITRVGIQEQRGQISPADAESLRQQAEVIRTSLGCP